MLVSRLLCSTSALEDGELGLEKPGEEKALRKAYSGLPGPDRGAQEYRIIESLRLEKTFKIIKSNLSLTILP